LIAERDIVVGVGDGLAVVGSGEHHLFVALDLAPEEGRRGDLIEVGLLRCAVVRDSRRGRLRYRGDSRGGLGRRGLSRVHGFGVMPLLRRDLCGRRDFSWCGSHGGSLSLISRAT